MKSEVRELGKSLNINQEIIDAHHQLMDYGMMEEQMKHKLVQLMKS